MADLATELRLIYAEHGNLRKQTIVDAARPPDHPLHDRFQWDDEKAAEAHRLNQAGELIRSVKVTFIDRGGQARRIHEFYSVTREGQRTYEPVEKVQEDPVTMEILIKEMRRDVDALMRRYGDMAEFWEVIKERLDPEVH